MKSAPYVRSASNRVCARTGAARSTRVAPPAASDRVQVAEFEWRARIAALATGAHERALAAVAFHTARFTSNGMCAVLAAPALAGTRCIAELLLLQLRAITRNDRLRTSATSPAGTA